MEPIGRQADSWCSCPRPSCAAMPAALRVGSGRRVHPRAERRPECRHGMVRADTRPARYRWTCGRTGCVRALALARQARVARRSASSATRSPSGSAPAAATRSARSICRPLPPRSPMMSCGRVEHGGVLRAAVAVVEVLACRGRRRSSVPAGRDGVGGRAHDLASVARPGVAGRRSVTRSNALRLGPVIQQVGGDPLGCTPRSVASRPRLLDPGLREVDAGHLPAALREPDGVAALAAGEVKRPARRQPAASSTRKRLGCTVQTNSLSA